MDFDTAFELIISAEGGYVNDPSDSGGETIFGICRRSYPSSLIFKRIDEYKSGGNTNPKILTDLCRNSDVFIIVQDIYRREYWAKCCCERLPGLHRYAVFDCAVNCGVRQASKFYQRALGVSDDGIIGPKTISAALNADSRLVYDSFLSQWGAFYDKLVVEKPKNKKFLRGWKKRIDNVRAVNS